MRYLPKSQSDRETMLREIGAKSIDDLFAAIPAEYRLKRDLKIPRQYAESEIVEFFRERAANSAQGYRHVPRRRRLFALPPGGHRLADLARRVLHLLHALSAGDRAGHAAIDLRVSDDDLRADRHGRSERLDVRRLNRRRRGADDGRRASPAAAKGVSRQDGSSGVSRGHHDLRAVPGHAGRDLRLRQGRPRRSRRARDGDRRRDRRRAHPVAQLLRHDRRCCRRSPRSSTRKAHC